MTNEKIAKYLDNLRAFEKEQHKLKDILYKFNIDIINFDNKAVDLLISMICEVSGISEENIEYFREFMFTQTIKLFKKEIYINKNNDIKTSKNNRGIKFIF